MNTIQKIPIHLWSLVTFIILISALLSGCKGEEETPITVPTGAEAGDLNIEPCIYETDDIEYTADCLTLVVPENREYPGARLIALPVIRIRTTGNDPSEPVFRFAGGPVISNMTFSLVPWFI